MLKRIKRELIYLVRRIVPYGLTHKIASALLNFNAMGGAVSYSGELNALRYVRKQLLQKFPHRNVVLFDVGANVGDYTKDMISQYGNSATVHCFEPSIPTYQRLVSNVGQYPNVRCHDFGLSNESGNMTMFTNEEGSGICSVYKRRLDHFNVSMDVIQECKFTTLDEFCKENSIQHLHFLKIDVEGHELSVLQGAKEMLGNKHIDYIQFEFGGCNIDSRVFFQDFWYLLNESYNIYKITPNGLYLIRKYSEDLEIFICQNFLAELK